MLVLAGPALIVAAVLFAARGYAFGGRLTAHHPDPLTFWLPVQCFLGKAIAAGNIPEWNPHVFGGVPFAADPQSGWMYLPAMGLYAALPCDVAARWFIVLQPLIAGFGLYAFFRSEGVCRSAATSGGLVLAVGVMAGSRTGATLPFAGSLAWTAVALWCAARAVRAGSWPSRALWIGTLAIAWGQAAAAHMSHGLIVATLVVATYCAATIVREVRWGRLSRRTALTFAGAALIALPLLNLAFFLPRLAYLPGSSIGLGYEELRVLAVELTPAIPRGFPAGYATQPTWPATLASVPGAYLGAAALSAVLAAMTSLRRRTMVLSLAALAFVTYVLSLGPVREALSGVVATLPFSDFYLHAPGRLSYATVLCLCVLAGFGLDEFVRAPNARVRLRLFLPGAALWSGAAVAIRDPYVFPAVVLSSLVVTALCFGIRRTAAFAFLLPVIVAAEMTGASLYGERSAESSPARGSGTAKPVFFWPIKPPNIDAAAYVAVTPLADVLEAKGGGRYISYAPRRLRPNDYRGALRPSDWGLLANQRSMLFGLEDAQGYNPAQLLRYWEIVRGFDSFGLKYNAAAFFEPPEAVLDLFQINYAIARPGRSPRNDMNAVAQAGDWVLYERRRPSPRAEAHSSWTVVGGPADARDRILSAVPHPEPVLEDDPGIRPGSGHPVAARYEGLGFGRARVSVTVDAPSVVVVRNSYDDHWRAEVDGRAADVFPADYISLGVAVPSGEHEIVFTYDDPWIERGLVGSGAALALLVLLAGVTAVRSCRTTQSP